MFIVPSNLNPYVDFNNGKMLISKDIPKELKKDVEELKKAYEATQKKNDLAEY
jgi:hypothetical protein